MNKKFASLNTPTTLPVAKKILLVLSIAMSTLLLGCSNPSYFAKNDECPFIEHSIASFLKGDSEPDSIYIIHSLKYHSNDKDIDNIFVSANEKDVINAIFKDYDPSTKTD